MPPVDANVGKGRKAKKKEKVKWYLVYWLLSKVHSWVFREENYLSL